MKITPIGPNSVPQQAPNQAHSPEKLAAAKAIAAGEMKVSPSETPVDDSRATEARNTRTIKLQTNVSPDRPIETGQEPEKNAISDTKETTTAVTEATAPISPELVALRKQQRALQVKERELLDREKALETKSNSPDLTQYVSIADLKSKGLKVLLDNGITYEQLTEQVLNQNSINPEIQALKAEIKSLKEGVDKTLSEKEAQQEKAVLQEIRREVDRVAAGDGFELVRASGSQADAVELIQRIYKEEGELLSESEALQLVETELLKEAEKYARLKKVQERLAIPSHTQQTQPRPQIRTLTNRDTAKIAMGRRERAIAAMLGQLKK